MKLKAVKQRSEGRGWPEKSFYGDAKRIEAMVRLAITKGATGDEIAAALGNEWRFYLELVP